ncbi:hypothetical protein ACH5RR_036129 [Cinchona calisaya]|uniref:Uncharacterized protein n=1 Tax=Cinchona calisaya TaxID=153742 RepID=A0ABD2Y4C5_9GENT
MWKLVRLWITEGFIPGDGSTSSSKSLEDLAENYLVELVERNFVIVGCRRSNSRIESCQIHDTLCDFGEKEAAKENRFQEIKRFDDQVTSVSADPSNNFRRLCMNSFIFDYMKSKPNGERVQSFLSFAKEEITLLPEHVASIPKASKLLRVLDIRSIILTRFPAQLHYLVLLKYFAFSSDIWKMPQTNVSACLQYSMEPSISANLQALSTISLESCSSQVFDRTPKLKKLGMCGKLVNIMEANGQSSLLSTLFSLEELENLKLLNDDIAFKLHDLPPENLFPRRLTRLTLLNTSLDWRNMSTLGKLENLEVLKLKDNALQGELRVTEDGGFRNVKVLPIGSTNLVMWKASASHFPILRSLFLKHCTKLEAVPSGLRCITTLQEIDLYCTTSLKILSPFVSCFFMTDLANEIRSLVHEVEDVVETCVVHESLYRSKSFGGKLVHGVGHLTKLSTVGETIQKLSEKVKRTCEDNKEISIHALAMEDMEKKDAIQENSVKSGDQGTDKIIGFRDAADKMIELLMGKKLNPQSASELEQQSDSTKSESEEQQGQLKQREVASIVGMLGLGKTTLARKVLNDPRIEYHFFTRIFVSVSNEYKKKEVLLSILSPFDKNIREQNKSEGELVGMVKEKLKNKYLIVLDDVWTKEAWDDLEGAFPDYNKGSRVLITTRHRYVANYAKTKIEPYNLRFMTPEESRELLRTKVFGENNCPIELQPIETEILAKCGGLPLAIVVTAGILRNDRDNKQWWEDVRHGADNLVVDDHKQTEKLIRMSYDNLPSKLKPCFLYLGVFPEDFDIQVSKLLWLWIAEGFIPQAKNRSLERIAELYLVELVDRNLVMVGPRSLNGRMKTCKVHDTLRDFCKKTAQQENLFQEIDTAGNISSSSGRRLSCISSHISTYISKKPSAESARSFLSFAQEETFLQEDICAHIVKPFKLLRVLDILSVKLTGRFPTAQLLTLVLLKYIAISCDLKLLPEKMSKLINLQTIIIHTTSPTLDIKADIWRMSQLRHLYTNTSTLLPKCLPQQEQSSVVIGENLQSLTTISPESLRSEVFERTKNLKKLGIRGKLGTLVKANGESSLFDSIAQLVSLEKLKLCSDDANSRLLALPPGHKFPIRLTRLSMQYTSLDWSHMSTLGKLEYLEVLKLKDNAFKGNHWQTDNGSFRSLKSLYIGATDLKVWNAEASCFPKLRCLVLKHCNKLERIPAAFAGIKSLEMINLECTNDSVVSSGRNILLLQLQMLRQQKDNETSSIKLIVYPPE